MGKIRKIALSKSERSALLQSYREGKTSVFRQRCHMILLKSEGRTSKDVGAILGSNLISVNNWLARYEQEGIAGLTTRPGRGRKRILDMPTDEEKVRQVVTQERQRLKRAKVIWKKSCKSLLVRRHLSVRSAIRF